MAGSFERDFGVELQADAEFAEQCLSVGFACGPKSLNDLGESGVGWKQIAVLQLPEPLVGVTKFVSEVGGTVDLPLGSLSDLAVDIGEVVAIDRAGSASDRARRSLREIVLIDANAALGRDVGASHFKQVELRRDLEHCVSVGHVRVQCANVTDNFADGAAARFDFQTCDGLPKLRQFGCFQTAKRDPLAIGTDDTVAIDREFSANLIR